STRRCLLGLLVVWLGLVATSARAQAAGLRVPFADYSIRIDGSVREHRGVWRKLESFSGSSGGTTAEILLVHDDVGLYVAARVQDDVLVAGRDHVELLLGIPGGTLHSLLLYPGQPGKTPARVKTRGGRVVSAARIVEAPTTGGYDLEAFIPWRVLPKSRTTRIGFRGAVFLHDVDRRGARPTILGMSKSRLYAALPPLSTEPELALGSGLLMEKGLTDPPQRNLLANVHGDGQRERVLVYGRHLVVLGPRYRKGRQYFFRDLGSDASAGELTRFELRDVTGDGRADILLERLFSAANGRLRLLEIFSYHHKSDTPSRVFAHVTGWRGPSGAEARSQFVLRRRGRSTEMVVMAASRGSEQPPQVDDAEALIVAGGGVASRRYRFDGVQFGRVGEKRRASHPPRAPRVPKAPAPANGLRGIGSGGKRSTQATVLTHQGVKPTSKISAYALYKKRARVVGRPRFDRRGDLSGDRRAERVVVHGLDLVVFGPGFRGGRGFAAMTLPGFAAANDVRKMRLRAAPRGSKKIVEVRGVIRSALPDDLGPGEMEREVIMLFAVRGGHFERVFAAEIGRRVGRRWVRAEIRFSRDGIVLKPGRARGYDAQSYPWRQRTESADGFEPLLLPWGGMKQVSLRFDGRQFRRIE
ncbi:MAG: hypothetical protein VB934_05890, partial [Polyangiaceae bacterium]